MLNIDDFRCLCHNASIEQDPAKLEKIKNELRLILRTEEIQMYRVQWKPASKPN
jgi:hypothetical protein